MRIAAVLLAATALFALPAWAGDQGTVTVGVSKAELLHLPAPAQRVIIANPAIADVTVEKPTLITLFGKAAGETSLTVLSADDQVIYQRAIVVTSAGEHTVTVHVPGGGQSSQGGQGGGSGQGGQTSQDGPTSREYVCVGQRCSKVDAPAAASSNGAVTPLR